jgi:hypothetical protein
LTNQDLYYPAAFFVGVLTSMIILKKGGTHENPQDHAGSEVDESKVRVIVNG